MRRSAAILGVQISAARALRIAQRSRSTPPIANRLLRRVRDYAQVRAEGHIEETVAQAALDLLQVDPEGLDALDRKLLLTIMERFEGGPVGIDSLSAAIGEERGTLEDVIEPFLIQQGFVTRTARGRIATRLAWQHFGLRMPERAAANLPLFGEGAGQLHLAGACLLETPTPAASFIMRATCTSSSERAPSGCARRASTRASSPWTPG